MNWVLFSNSAGPIGLAQAAISESDIIAYVPNIFPFMIVRVTGDAQEFRRFAYVHHTANPKFWGVFDMSNTPKETIIIQ